MADMNLQVNYRSKTGKAYRKELSRRGMVAGVVYGKAVGSVPVELEYKPLRNIIVNARNSIIDLELKGAAGDSQSYKVLIKDMQYDPIRRLLNNIDFHQVSMDNAITALVTINFIGELKTGVAQFGIRELQVSCLPADIPGELTLNLEGLAVGETVTVESLHVPENVTVLDDPGAAVVTVLAERKEETVADEEVGEGETAGEGTPAEEA